MSLPIPLNLDSSGIRCDQWLAVLDELNIGAFTVNHKHHITAINYCGQALMELNANEVIGCDCREIFTGVPCMSECIISKNSQPRLDEPDVEVKDEMDGTHFITRMATPIYDNDNRVVGCFTILQDHSPVSDLIDRLRYEQRSLKNILDSLDVGIFTVNRGGLLTFFNKAAEKFSGFQREELLGLPCTAIFESKLTEDVCLHKESNVNADSHGNRHGWMIDKEGVAVPIRANYMALRNEKGITVGGLATFQDMTLLHRFNQAIKDRYSFNDMIGKGPAMQKIFDMIPVVAQSDATVLIEGATGTGKDLLAKVIHSASRRADNPLVKINCAAIPETLIESEIFGYVKGAFTGADRDKPGRFQEADGSTIFLDEIGDLPLALQGKLLRVLEDKEFYPLGSQKTQKVDVRIISATNRGLEKLIKKRQFREDLFFRLNVVRIELPTLNQRRDDLPLLIRHILRELCAARGATPPAMADTAMGVLLNYAYPGNVRELENILEHALILCQNGPIEYDHLPDYVRLPTAPRTTGPAQIQSTPAARQSEEAQRILRALKRHNGHRGKTAQALGIDRTTLWRKTKRYGLND